MSDVTMLLSGTTVLVRQIDFYRERFEKSLNKKIQPYADIMQWKTSRLKKISKTTSHARADVAAANISAIAISHLPTRFLYRKNMTRFHQCF